LRGFTRQVGGGGNSAPYGQEMSKKKEKMRGVWEEVSEEKTFNSKGATVRS